MFVSNELGTREPVIVHEWAEGLADLGHDGDRHIACWVRVVLVLRLILCCSIIDQLVKFRV